MTTAMPEKDQAFLHTLSRGESVLFTQMSEVERQAFMKMSFKERSRFLLAPPAKRVSLLAWRLRTMWHSLPRPLRELVYALEPSEQLRLAALPLAERGDSLSELYVANVTCDRSATSGDDDGEEPPDSADGYSPQPMFTAHPEASSRGAWRTPALPALKYPRGHHRAEHGLERMGAAQGGFPARRVPAYQQRGRSYSARVETHRSSPPPLTSDECEYHLAASGAALRSGTRRGVHAMTNPAPGFSDCWLGRQPGPYVTVPSPWPLRPPELRPVTSFQRPPQEERPVTCPKLVRGLAAEMITFRWRPPSQQLARWQRRTPSTTPRATSPLVATLQHPAPVLPAHEPRLTTSPPRAPLLTTAVDSTSARASSPRATPDVSPRLRPASRRTPAGWPLPPGPRALSPRLRAASRGTPVVAPSCYPFDTFNTSAWSSSIFSEAAELHDQPGSRFKPADATASRSLALLSKAQVNGVLASAGLAFRT